MLRSKKGSKGGGKPYGKGFKYPSIAEQKHYAVRDYPSAKDKESKQPLTYLEKLRLKEPFKKPQNVKKSDRSDSRDRRSSSSPGLNDADKYRN